METITSADTTPDAADTTPDAVDTTPDAADTTPDAAGSTPDAVDTTPDVAGSTPDTAESADPKLRYRCRHIFADGHRCGSPALRGEPFCYYHHINRRPKPAAGKFRHVDAWEPFELPLIEDRASALQVTSLLLSRIASNDLDPTRAGHLIRGLQAIARFLPRESGSAAAQAQAPAPIPVEDPIFDEDYGALAPIEEVPEAAPARASASVSDEPEPADEDESQEPRSDRDYTAEEQAYFDGTIKGYGWERGTCCRPATVTDRDIVVRVNAERRRAYPTFKLLKPVTDDSGKLLAIHSWLDQTVAWADGIVPPKYRSLDFDEFFAKFGRESATECGEAA